MVRAVPQSEEAFARLEERLLEKFGTEAQFRSFCEGARRAESAGDLSEADQAWTRAYFAARRVFGWDHKETQKVVAERERVLRSLGREDEAGRCAEELAAVAAGTFTRSVYEEVQRVAIAWGADRLVDSPHHCRLAVNEAFVRLADEVNSRERRLAFYESAARAIEGFVGKSTELFTRKLGTTLLHDSTTVTMTKEHELKARRAGLKELWQVNPVQAAIHELRWFAGREFDEIASLLNLGDVGSVRREYEIAGAEVNVRGGCWAASEGWITPLGA